MIERERFARIVGWLVWGIDTRPLYASMDAIRRVPVGATIIDVPCGGGVAFRALDAAQLVRYIAIDLAETMLERARRRARQRGLDQVELIPGDMCALPLENGIADLCLSYGGLHCLADPAAAAAEIARCLRPGGELIGTTFLSTGTRRQRALLGAGQRRGDLGPMGTKDDLQRWFEDAGVAVSAIEPDRGSVLFRGRKRA
jgi:ubiquinone/menaquinone biosynthesis C-methylase UbiE